MAAAAEKAGHEVMLCVRTPTPGLTIERDGKSRKVPVAIVEPGAGGQPDLPSPVDWILLATKAHQTEGAAPWIARLAGPGTVLVVVQNGVDHEERVARLGHPGPVLPALACISASQTAPGHVLHAHGTRFVVPDGEYGRTLAEVFAGSGLDIVPETDFTSAMWRKMLVNVGANAVTALTGRTLSVLDSPGMRDLTDGLMAEAVAVANAYGASLSEADMTRAWGFYGELGPDGVTSMLSDRLAGRMTEHDFITGAVVRAADRKGLDVPLSRTVLALLTATSPCPDTSLILPAAHPGRGVAVWPTAKPGRHRRPTEPER
jgi:2-dehydropantoate 2-reductase